MSLFKAFVFKSTIISPKISIQPLSINLKDKSVGGLALPGGATINLKDKSVGGLALPGAAFLKNSTNLIRGENLIRPTLPKVIRHASHAPLISVSSVKSKSDRDNDSKIFTDKFKTVNKKFSTFESLTGLSNQRPELLMLTEFKPIYNEDFNRQNTDQFAGQNFVKGLNDYGDYIDIQLQVQNLYHYNIAKTIKGIKDSDPDQKENLENREKIFLEVMSRIILDVEHLYNMSKALDTSKDSFNLKVDHFVITWENIIRTYYQDVIEWAAPYLGTSRNFISLTPSKFLTKFGYQDNGIANFSSSKIYLQILAEFRNLISNYSSKLLNRSVDIQKNDYKAVSLNTSANNAWHDVSRTASDIESPVYEDITHLNGYSVPAAIPRLIGFFDQIDKSFVPVFSNPEEKIAFYSHFISREFRYSSALANEDTQKFLAQTYGYQVNAQGSNFNVFDFIIGRIGTKITDVFVNDNSNTLTTPSQIMDGDVLVLPFENKYLELDGAIFTPGSEFLIDSIFENSSAVSPDGSPLDISKLEAFANSTNQVSNKFTEFVERMRFFNQIPVPDRSKSSFGNRSTMESPQKFVELIYDGILSGQQVPNYEIAHDPMSALLSLAYKDKTLKALLFMYVIISNAGNSISLINPSRKINNITGKNSQSSNDQQSALEKIIQEITARLSSLVTTRFTYLNNDIHNIFGNVAEAFKPYNNVNTSNVGVDPRAGASTELAKFNAIAGTKKLDFHENKTPGNTQNYNEITIENIANYFRHGSPALNFLKSTITSVISAFKNNSAFIESRTRYSDINDSLLVAFTYELCLTVFDNHLSTRFINRYVTKSASSIGREYYTISNSQPNTGASVSLVKTKISDEVDLTIQCIAGIIAMQRRVVDSSLTIVNRVRDIETIKVLNEVTTILGSRKYLGHLMNEQQLILAKSNIDEIRLKLFSKKRSVDLQMASSRATSSTDDISVLDETTITGNLRNAFYAFFALPQFTSKKAFNSRILTVGIPNGFAASIREKIRLDKLNSNYNKKQVDIVNLTVYKTDFEFQDIIFKPQKFLFELSRFVLHNENNISSVGINSTLDELVRAIPTRDYSIEIYDKTDVLSSKSIEETPLFTDPQYSFLTTIQKSGMLANHISSNFIEIYLRMLTGTNTSEHSFELLLEEQDRLKDKSTIEEEFMNKLIVSSISRRVPPPEAVLPRRAPSNPLSTTLVASNHPSSIDNQSYLPFDTTKNRDTRGEIRTMGHAKGNKSVVAPDVAIDNTQISKKIESLIKQDVFVIQDLAKVSTVISDPNYEAQRILRPKEFERIFHVVVDPDDFEIDLEATRKTPQGNEALLKMIKQKIVIDIDENEITTQDRSHIGQRYKLVERNASENNLIFEKYFVTFETVIPSTVDDNDPTQIKREK